MRTLETPRLILRAWQESDAPDLYAYARLPEVGPPAGWKPHLSPAESRVIIRELFIKHDDCWAVTLRGDNRPVGSIGLHEDPLRRGLPSRMLGYTLAPAVWGRGLATEAARAVLAYGFDNLGLLLISVNHFPDNLASRRVIEKLGFVPEGTLRQATAHYSGRGACDLTCYSMTYEEYRVLCRGG